MNCVISIHFIWGFLKFKGLVHFKMKITPSFTHPQTILGVCDLILSDEHNQSYINKYPDASKLYNGSEWETTSMKLKKVLPSIINVFHTALGG